MKKKKFELLKKIVCSRYVNRQVLIVRERRLTYRRATTKRFEPVLAGKTRLANGQLVL